MLRIAQSFFKDRQGAVAITIALMSVALIGLIALGVDFARSYAVKSRLGYAIDAAALYGGSNIASATVEADMRKIFDANFPNDYLGSYDVQFNPTVDVNNDTITVAVDASIPTTLGRILGVDKIDIGTANQAKRKVTGIELTMVLDITSSMSSSGKMPAMKTAAQGLIDILYGSESVIQNFWVSLVPFKGAVNIGNQYTGWLTGYNSSDFSPSTWKGCVQARIGASVGTDGNDVTDAPPSVERFAPYYYTSGLMGRNFWPQGGSVYENLQYGSVYGSPSVYGPNVGCGYEVTPLTADKGVISAAIANLNWWQVVGGTEVNTGLVWGWRTLSPKWRGLWQGTPVNLPLDYHEPFMKKVAIVLTDGNNTWPSSTHTAYGPKPSGYSASLFNSKLSTVCEAMKTEGITIYSITFGTNISIQTQNLMRNCASSSNEHYYHSPSNTDLQVAFQQIGSDLSSLRLSQ